MGVHCNCCGNAQIIIALSQQLGPDMSTWPSWAADLRHSQPHLLSRRPNVRRLPWIVHMRTLPSAMTAYRTSRLPNLQLTVPDPRFT